MQSDGNTPIFDHGHLLAERYRLVEKVGEGGAAEVFRAVDQRLDRTVAVKLLRPQFTSDPASRQRFAVEAKAAAGLSHPNIVDVYDFGEAPDGSMFLVMQFVQGQNLKDVLQKRGRMSPDEVVSIARQVCQALSLAHAKGLIHRDVKPQNIMIDPTGNARLTDFGVVKALSAPALTQSGMTFGTAAYLSPEQATGAAVSPASDIYALGCVMYEMLAGTPPFTGDNPAVVAYKQVWEQPRPLHDVVPEVPPSLEAVIMRCLNKEPQRRYGSTDDLIGELDRISVAFTQPTQMVPLGAVAQAGAAAHDWTPAQAHAPAERSLPIPMQPAPADGIAGGVPPVRAQTTNQGTPTVAVPPNPPRRVAPPAPYTGGPIPPQTVIVPGRRGVSWLPVALAALLLFALIGFLAWQGRGFFGGGAGDGQPNPSPTGAAQASPTAPLGGIGVESPTLAPTNTPAPAPTDTPQPAPTDTPPPPPTDTPAPLPTDTPQPEPLPTDMPEPVPPTDTPAPGPEPPTPTPPPPPQPVGTAVTVEDAAFVGGYTRSNGLYHGRTAHWVYGQGTQYHTMTASFDVNEPPSGPATLTVLGNDSEDRAKTPMRIVINDAVVIYQGPNPLPNDDTSGPNGPGIWGSYQWEIPAGVLQPGANTISISNLDPSDRINYPIFIMVDYINISW